MSRSRNTRPQPTDSSDIARRADAVQYAKCLRNQGFYGWADNWDHYAKAPVGTPMPPNYHTTPQPFADGTRDERMSIYPHTIQSDYGGSYDAVMYKLEKDMRRNKGQSLGYVHSDQEVQELRESLRLIREKRKNAEEKSMRELGLVQDQKGHSVMLLGKLRELRALYPKTYYHERLMSVGSIGSQ